MLRPGPPAAAADQDVMRRTCTRSDDPSTALAELLAVQAALTQAAGPLADGVAREREHLRAAMASRATIETARGIVIAQQGCGPDAASAELRRRSRYTDRTIRDIAEDLVLVSAPSSSTGDVR